MNNVNQKRDITRGKRTLWERKRAEALQILAESRQILRDIDSIAKSHKKNKARSQK